MPEINLTQEADGTLILEVDHGDIQIYVEITEAEALDICQDIQAALEEKWRNVYEPD